MNVKAYVPSHDGQLLLTLVIATLFYLVQFVFRPWFQQRKRLIDSSRNLPGPPIGADHPHPWLQEIGTFMSLPSVPGRPSLPLMVPHLVEQCIRYSREEAGGHGLFRIWAFNPFWVPFARCVVHVFDPRLIVEILGGGGYGKFTKGHAIDVARPLMGESIFTLRDGPEWKAQRKLASPGFGHTVLEHTTEVAARLLHENIFPKWDWASGSATMAVKSVDMKLFMLRFTLDVIGEVAFSYSFGSTKTFDPHFQTTGDDSMYHTFDTIVETLMIRCRSPPFRALLPTTENKKFKAACDKLDSVVGKIITERMKEQELSESDPNKCTKKWKDLLSQILMKDEDGNRLPHKYLLGNIKTFLFAGNDTTAMTLSYALWHLASHPNIQQQLYNEVSPLFASSEQHPTYSDLRNLKFLDAVMKETLRLNAPAGMARRALQDVTVGGKEEGQHQYMIPKGCQVYVYPWFVHRHPKHWDRPEQYDPNRFLSAKKSKEGNREKLSSNPFMPFSVGPRNCIGLQLAMAEIRATLAHIVYKFKLEPADGTKELSPMFMMTIAPDKVMIKVEPR